MPMGTPINWSVPPGSPVLQHPLYLKYSGTDFTNVVLAQIKTDINSALASNESAEIVAYLCWLLRVCALTGGGS